MWRQNLPARISYSRMNALNCFGKLKQAMETRSRYNGELEAYRTASIAAIRKAVMDGYKDKTAEERVAIWEEFCRRAKATPDERKKAEE